MSLAVTSSVCLGLLIPFTVGMAQDIVVQEGTSVPTLGAAILSARPGDHIVVRRGVYREPTIVIDVPGITIEGDSGAVFDGDGDRFYRLEYDPFKDALLVLSVDETAFLQVMYLIWRAP